MKFTRLTAIAIASLLTLPAQAESYVDVFSELYVFGDSLSDAGDSFPGPFSSGPGLDDLSNTFTLTALASDPPGDGFPPAPYFNGRFSNGPVYTDFLAGDFAAQAKPTRNYAFGAAQAVSDTGTVGGFDVPDLADQLSTFLAEASGSVGHRPLAVLFFGANDIFDAFLSLADPPSENPVAAAVQAARAIGAAVDEIGQATGINDFVLLNLGDIGTTPRFNPAVNPLVDAGIQALAGLATQALNDELAAQADRLSADYNVIEVDVATRVAQIIADPSLIGLSDPFTPCGVPTGVSELGLPLYDFGSCDPDVFKVFWDDVHPTAPVHAELARLTRAAIAANVAPVPVPLPAALLGGGLVALGAVRLRRRRICAGRP